MVGKPSQELRFQFVQPPGFPKSEQLVLSPEQITRAYLFLSQVSSWDSLFANNGTEKNCRIAHVNKKDYFA